MYVLFSVTRKNFFLQIFLIMNIIVIYRVKLSKEIAYLPISNVIFKCLFYVSVANILALVVY